MTYPPPPQPYYTPSPYDINAYLAPARKAGLLMIILGALGILFGGCLGVGFSIIPEHELTKVIPPNSNTQLDASMIKVVMYIVAGLMIVVSGIQVGIGIWVRGGSMVSIVIAIVLTSLIILYLALNMVVALVQGQIPSLAIGIVFVAPFGLLLVWLIQAAKQCKNLDIIRMYSQQTQMQQPPYRYPGQPQYQYPPPQGFAGYPQQQQQQQQYPPQQPPAPPQQ